MNPLDRSCNFLIGIKSESPLLNILIIPPIHGLWLLAVARLVTINKETRSILSFLIISLTILTTFFISAFLIGMILTIPELFEMWFYLLFTEPLRIIITIQIVNESVRYEEAMNLRAKSSTPGFRYRYSRYASLIDCITGFWSFQKIVNVYTNTNKPII